MEKMLRKPIVFLPILVLFIMVSISAQKSLWPSVNGLSEEGKEICVQFQQMRGSNRISEFGKLCGVVFESSGQVSKPVTLSTLKYDGDDIERMFGKADAVLLNGDWVYYLNPSQESCKAIVKVSKSTQTVYCSIADCD